MAVCARTAEEPADAAKRRLSTTVCCSSRARLAPSAERTARSRVRATARASMRLVTLRQASAQIPNTTGVEQQKGLARVVADRLLIAGNGNARWHVVAGDFFGDDGLRPAESRSQLRRRHPFRQPRKCSQNLDSSPLIAERLAAVSASGVHICICRSRSHCSSLWSPPSSHHRSCCWR